MLGEQIALFELPESRESNFLEWSHSRRETLEQCARKYYYEYYGSKLQKAKDDPQKEKIRFLFALQNRHLRTGNILHFVIKTYFNKLQHGEQWSLNRLLSWARKIYTSDLKYSRRYEHGTLLPDGKYPPALLLEFYYDLHDAEFLCTEAEERLITALTNFMESKNVDQFREIAGKTSAMIEKVIYFKEGNFTLRGGIDLAYRENDRFVIVDWKIGKSSSNDNSLQMLAYAWWAKQEFRHLVDCIIPHRVHLADDTVSTFNVSEKALTRVEARILQDLERMQEADKYGKQGRVEAFTPCAQPNICKLCQFQEVCSKE